MSRDSVPFVAADVSAFARSLGRSLKERSEPTPPGHVELLNLIARAAGHRNFHSRGRLIRWPHKFSVQTLAMWVLWTLFDARRIYSEREVNTILKAAHVYGDHVTLRRELINHKLLARESDCSRYWKLAQRPDDEVRALLAAWRSRKRDASAAQERRAVVQ